MNFKFLLVILIILGSYIVSADLNTGIISHYYYNDSTDAVGTYNATTFDAGITTSNCKIGKCASFNANGSIQYAAAQTNSLSAGTINFWVRPNAASSYNLFAKNAAAFRSQFVSGGGGQYFFVNSEANFYSYMNTGSGGITMYTYTWNSTHKTFSINGTQLNTTTTGAPFTSPAAGSLYIGHNSVNTNERLAGLIDELTIWNVSLTTSQITDLFTLQNSSVTYPFPAVSPGNAINASEATVITPVLSLSTQTYQFNLTYNASVNSTNATFFFNNTRYFPTLTRTIGNLTIDSYSISVIMPDVTNGTIIASYWQYNYTWVNATIVENNTTAQNQTLLNLLLGNCTSGVTTNTVLNYTIRDVETDALISASSIFNVTVEYGNLSETSTFSFASSSNPRICVYPSFIEMNYDVTASLSASGYAPNSYISFGSVSNITNNITIYLTNASSGAAINYIAVDSSEIPLAGLTINTFEYDVGTGTLTQINSLVTDTNGEGVAFLILNQYFVWKIYDDGELVLTEGPSYMALTETSRTFIIGGNITTGLTNWITVYGLSCTVTNGTSPLGVTTTWNSTNANISNYCLNLFNVSGGNMVNYNQTCSSNQSGNLFLPVYNETSWLAFPTMTSNGSDTTYILWCNGASPLSFNTLNVTTPLFGTEGVFWALILLILMVTIGLAGQGAEYISMVLIIGWTAAISLFELIPLGYSTFMGIAAFLIVWLMGVNRER